MHSTTQYNFLSKNHGLKSKVCINRCIKMLCSQKRKLHVVVTKSMLFQLDVGHKLLSTVS